MDQHLSFLCLFLSLFLQFPFNFSWNSLTFLDLGSNLLEGSLPSSLCNLSNLEYLLLSGNSMTGPIPHCFSNISSQLKVLDLRKNGFHGKIPTNFPEGNQLRNLGLNGNKLEGPIPKSLKNCKKLEVLDIGHNQISDTFPMWLESLPELSVLILASNQLHGTIGISETKSPFLKLRIFDISYNHFTGSLPAEMIKNFQAMKRVDNNNQTQAKYMGDGSYYDDSVTLMMKGLEIEIKRVLTIFTTIDLSGNEFDGKIPNSIGDLNSLKVLNFSRNRLIGVIPSTFGDLSQLESLDLSWNQLAGKIPVELGKLNFLSALNLSENQLEGRIPTGGQFNTFQNISFIGNKGLCGFPLKDCGGFNHSNSPESWKHHHKDLLDLMSGFTWKSVLFGYCFGTILGLSIGVVMFATRKPKWFVSLVEDMCIRSKTTRRGSIRLHQFNTYRKKWKHDM
ncbi:hypothetical protein ACH5RR_009865 [Cinchona calisaya]|uniref:Receptor-like protein 12 n=1 Tax=Cinchona calisaya TaxID=153742 RepID=A0ABD3AH63_9GENT